MRSRLKSGMGAFGLLLILGFNAMIGHALMREYRATVEDARDETRNLARILEGHATDSIAGVDKILAGVAEVLSVRPDRSRHGDPAIRALLRRQAALSPLLRAILVVGPDGRLAQDSTTDHPPPLDLSDRDYVVAQRDGTARGSYLGPAVRGRSSGTWFISMSRRFSDPEGRFAGVVVGVIEPVGFRHFYETLKLPHGAVVCLLHMDGTVLARHPGHDDAVGRPARDMARFREMLSTTAASTAETDGDDGRPPRIVSVRRSEDFPLAIGVSVERAAVLAPWSRKAEIAAVVLVGGNGMLGLLIFLLLREISRRERMVTELQASERALLESQSRLIQDIAARHHIESELIAAKRASDEANRAKTRFLANMSHELRTPLNAIIGFSEALESGIFGSMPPKHSEYVADIRRSGQHLLALINDILDTTKIESGKLVLHEQVLLVPDLTAQCLRQMEPLAAERRVSLSLRLPAGMPGLYADDRVLTQILLNLLSNALKFTPSGGHTELAAGLSIDGTLWLRVADDGIGIAAEDLERVMEPFHQVDNAHTRLHPGTGLGLPLVKALTELHGGRFTLESSFGRGTVATVHLPATRLRALNAAATGERPSALFARG